MLLQPLIWMRTLMLSGVTFVVVLAAAGPGAQAASAGAVMQLAQAQTAENGYLPPWQKGGNPPAEDETSSNEPERITPPNRSAPPQGDGGLAQGDGGYDSDEDRYSRRDRYHERGYYDRGYDRRGNGYDRPPPKFDDSDSYSSDEVVAAGERFFGTVSRGLAGVIEYAFQRYGRPNGYILGEDAGGAFFAGLRYGEGWLYTKNAGRHKVYWQGPSIGYDVGAAGSRTMVLVYNLYDIDQIYHRFAGVDGSAYVIGGVGITFQNHNDVVLAPIRAGIGLRLGANVGYLKYTRRPTWNPF